MSQVAETEYTDIIEKGHVSYIKFGVYCQSSASNPMAIECEKRFCMGQEFFEDDARSKRLMEVTTGNKMITIEELILSESQILHG